MANARWEQELRKRYGQGTGHAFLINGRGVYDYTPGVNADGKPEYLMMERYLAYMFSEWIVVCYDPARKFWFPHGEGDEKAFKFRAGLIEEVDAALASMNPDETGELPLPTDTATALELIEKALTWVVPTDDNGDPTEKQVVAIIFNLDILAPDTPKGLSQEARLEVVARLGWWGRYFAEIGNNGNQVIALTTNLYEVHPDIRGSNARWEIIEAGSPTPEERLEYIRYLMGRVDEQGNPVNQLVLGELSPEKFATITAGLTYLHLENIAMVGIGLGVPVTAKIVRDTKKRIIEAEYGGLIELVDSQFTLDDLAGREPLKVWAYENIIYPVEDGNLNELTKGAVFTGSPGVGKTFATSCIAGSSGLNFVILNAGKLKDRWVGSTEANVEKVMKLFSDLFPLILLVDEADAVFKNRETAGDNDGVTNTTTTRFMTFMSDTENEGKVVFILCTNFPGELDPALTRPGRLSDFIPFTPPTLKARHELLKLLSNKTPHNVPDDVLGKVAETLEGWTEAEITGLWQNAIKFARRDAGRGNHHNAVVSVGNLTKAATVIVRSTREVQNMTDAALIATNNLELIEPEYIARRERLVGNTEQTPKAKPPTERKPGGRKI
jgi:transitional endoplasmic reticulum ATPase